MSAAHLKSCLFNGTIGKAKLSMRILIYVIVMASFGLTLAGCSSAPAPELQHSNFSDVPTFRLHVDSSLLSQRQARISISVPSRVSKFSAPLSYGGGPLFLKFISNLEAKDQKGNLLEVKVENNFVTVAPQITPYTLTYIYNVPQKIPGEVDLSLPAMDETKGRFDNHVTFLAPQGLANSPARLEISVPKSWAVATSWGKGRQFTVPKVSELIAGVEVFGAYEFSEEKVGNINVTYAIAGEFSHKIIKDQFAKVFLAQQEIAGPFPHPLLLLVLQDGKTAEAKGTSLTNALVVNIPPAQQLEPFNFQVMGTASHELFHQWNIRYVYPANVEGNYLFSEGFTNYFSVAALVHAGLIPEERFARFLWKYKEYLEANPNYPKADFAKIQSGFSGKWDSTLVDLAYTKGPFVAILLDLALREDSSNKQSLASWFRILVERFGGRQGYEVDDLRALIIEVSGKPNGKAQQVFDHAFSAGKKLDLQGLIQRFGIRCDKNAECSLAKLSESRTLQRSKVFSAKN